MKALRIVFAGTPEFAVPTLRGLISRGFTPLAVLTQPDRPAGRGRQLQGSPVKNAALEAGIPVLQPGSLKDRAVIQQIKDFQPDLMIVVAYGLILPPEVLELPSHGCWNIHASLLPRWRGAAPIQRAIEAGDEESGVCIMQMDEGLDTGDILEEQRIKIEARETGGSLHDKLALLGADALVRCVIELAQGHSPAPDKQPESGATYAAKLQKPEAGLDWSMDAITLERKVRAFNPWPVAWCDIGGERTRIWDARAVPGSTGTHRPGHIIEAGPEGIKVATGRGILRILNLQKPGGRPVTAAEYLNSNTLPSTLADPP